MKSWSLMTRATDWLRPVIARLYGKGHVRCEHVVKDTANVVSPEDTVQTAARKMRDANIGFLPVIDVHRKVMGVLTGRDIATRACASDRTASATQIGDVMTRNVLSCRPSDEIAMAQELMSQNRKSRLICCDDAGRLVGVISLTDIAAYRPATGRLRAAASAETNPSK